MKKLALIAASLLAACSTTQLKTTVPTPNKLVSKVKPVKTKPTKIAPQQAGNLTYILEVTYDSCHFKFESMGGKLEHAELYENGKRYLCFESLKPENTNLFFSREPTLYDNNWGPNCDGKVDLITTPNHSEFKRPKDPWTTIYNSEFLAADALLKKFKKDYRVEEIRKEWLKRKDSCKKGLCSFEVERTTAPKIDLDKLRKKI